MYSDISTIGGELQFPVYIRNVAPMNPHASPSISLTTLWATVWRNRRLITQMAQREVVGRYRGSALGMAWSFLNPLLMLTVYTFVFSVVMKARWGGPGTEGEADRAMFAVILFVGMIVHGLLAEVLNRSPTLIVGNANYVKKVVFPLEILPLVSLVAALFHCAVSFGVLLLAYLAMQGTLQWTAIFAPIVILPLAILIIGLAWFLASLGVFLRDVSQTTGIITTVMMFLAPVFYPVSALPEALRPWIMLNPLTFIIEQMRAVTIWGQLPDFASLGLYALGACVFAWLGYAWFQKTRKGFADVL